jgi:hypothetical protein
VFVQIKERLRDPGRVVELRPGCLFGDVCIVVDDFEVEVDVRELLAAVTAMDAIHGGHDAD